MSLISVYVEASVTCPKCQNPVHLNGLAESVLCDRCQNPVELGADGWVSMLSEEISEASQMEPGTGQESTQWGGLNAQLKYGRLDARCEKCKNPFPNLEPDSLTGQIFCPACGTKASARRAPDWAKRLHPAIVGVVGESLATDKAERLEGVEPVVIHCFSCGGQLSCDGSVRNPQCSFCGSENFLPDQLWLRLHPAATRQSWFLLLDLAGAVALLPEDCWHFAGIAYAPTGGAIVAYQDSDDNCFIDGLDANGFVAWRTKEIPFSDETLLVSGPAAQYVVLVDEEKNFLQYIDPKSGAALWRIEGRSPGDDDGYPSDPRPFDLEHHHGVAVDADGTIVVLQCGDDETYPLLTRYSGDGSFQPMWSQDFGRRKEWEQPEWDRLEAGLLIPPDDAKLCIGNDGNLYLLDEHLKAVAAFDRDGRLLYTRQLSGPEVDDVHTFGVDAGGNLYALVEMDGGGKSDWSHVIRILTGHQPEILAGPGKPGSAAIGEYDERMSVAPNGNCYIAHELDSIRIIDGYGQLLWRSHATEKRDAED